MSPIILKPQSLTKMKELLVKLNKQKSVTNHRLARNVQLNAKLLAPVKTGRLINSIRIRRLKTNGRQVMVTARSGSFPYPRWVNQSAGFTTLTFPKGGPFGLRKGAIAIYGRSPAHWRWTGRPRFFRTAIQRTRKQFRSIALRSYNKALGVRVG